MSLPKIWQKRSFYECPYCKGLFEDEAFKKLGVKGDYKMCSSCGKDGIYRFPP